MVIVENIMMQFLQMSKKCPKCGRFMEIEDFDEFHYICNHCGLFWCFEKGCHCCEG